MQRHRAADAAPVALGQRVHAGEVDPPLDEEGDRVPGPGRHPPGSPGAHGEGAEGRIAARRGAAVPASSRRPAAPAGARSSTTASAASPLEASSRWGWTRPSTSASQNRLPGGLTAGQWNRGGPLPVLRGEEALHGAAQQPGERQRRLHRGLGATGLDGVECLAAHAQPPGQLGLGPALEEASFADEARTGTARGATVAPQRAPCQVGATGRPGWRAMLTERDLIMRLVRQLAEVLAAALQAPPGGQARGGAGRHRPGHRPPHRDGRRGALPLRRAGAGRGAARAPPAAGAAAPRPRPPPPRDGRPPRISPGTARGADAGPGAPASSTPPSGGPDV